MPPETDAVPLRSLPALTADLIPSALVTLLLDGIMSLILLSDLFFQNKKFLYIQAALYSRFGKILLLLGIVHLQIDACRS